MFINTKFVFPLGEQNIDMSTKTLGWLVGARDGKKLGSGWDPVNSIPTLSQPGPFQSFAHNLEFGLFNQLLNLIENVASVCLLGPSKMVSNALVVGQSTLFKVQEKLKQSENDIFSSHYCVELKRKKYKSKSTIYNHPS